MEGALLLTLKRQTNQPTFHFRDRETRGVPGPTSCLSSTCPSLPTGEVRAHLLPSKACRPRTPRSLSSDPQPPPPPLPKKTLARTQSLPTRRAPCPSSARAGQPRRPLQRSPSEDVSRATALTLDGPRAALGLSAHPLNSPEAVQAALAARQLDALRDIHARLRARLMGGRPGPCLPGHSFRLLDSLPCVESGEALYYRVVRVDGVAWHVLAAKVSLPLAPSTPGCPPSWARPRVCWCCPAQSTCPLCS